jgi:hypothetical protein
VKSVDIVLQLSVPDKADPWVVAEAVHDYMCDGGEGGTPFPDALVCSVDGVDVINER